ncbi:MAG: sulfotransferase [Synechococcales bacterium]|nr:sulfotransferase [Synechococcales bacterium]
MVAEPFATSSCENLVFSGPVFLIGMPRSGTKLLRGLLNGHSQIRIPMVETEFLPYWVRRWSDYGDLSQPKNFQRFYQDAIQLPYFIHIKAGSAIISQEEWFSRCRDFSPAGVFEALIRHKTGVEWGSGLIWGDKSPSYIGHLGLLKQLYPQARFIHIIRDVRDYCLSCQKAWGKHPVRAAQRWVDGVTKARQDAVAFADDYLEVHYEDLLEQTETVLRQCCEFLNVEFEASMEQNARLTEGRGDAKGYTSVKQDNTHKYRTRMAPRLVQRIEAIAGHVLRAGNYEVSYAGDPVRVPRWQMAYCQLLDGIHLVMSGIQGRGILGSLTFQWHYFRASGNRN